MHHQKLEQLEFELIDRSQNLLLLKDAVHLASLLHHIEKLEQELLALS